MKFNKKTEENKKVMPKWEWELIIMAVIIIIVAAFYVFSSSSNTSTTTSTQRIAHPSIEKPSPVSNDTIAPTAFPTSIENMLMASLPSMITTAVIIGIFLSMVRRW